MIFSSTGVSIRRFTKLAAAGQPLMLDVIVAEGPLETVWRTRTRIAFGDDPTSAVWAVSREGLITLKLAAGRPQDLVDVQRLEEVARGGNDT